MSTGMFGQQKNLNRTLAIDSPFQDSHQIYRLLLSPETLSSSIKSRIFLYNVHLALFVQMDDTNYPHKRIGYRHLVNWN